MTGEHVLATRNTEHIEMIISAPTIARDAHTRLYVDRTQRAARCTTHLCPHHMYRSHFILVKPTSW